MPHESAADDAERTCAYVIERVRRVAGARWAQGRHTPPFAARAGGEAVRTVAEQRLWRVGRDCARGLVAWANGERDVELFTSVPTPAAVLEMQAEGRRCVSLLPDELAVRPAYGVPRDAPDAGLAFALHDVCHLEKFADAAHFAGQVGFFRALVVARRAPGWAALEGRFDDAWRADVNHVGADMNGSAIFLFAALKMKLKMAARRELARTDGRPAPTGGPLDAREQRHFDARLDELFDLLDLRGLERADARAISTKHDVPESAERLERAFAARAG